jgi:hypothetical protein
VKRRDLPVVVILLALGTVLYAFMPNIAGVTPDMVYVFTTLALLLVRPKLGFALAIGIVADGSDHKRHIGLHQRNPLRRGTKGLFAPP